MNHSHRFFTAVCATLLAVAGAASAGLAFSGVASAQTSPDSRPPQVVSQPPEWERLSPAQRDALIAVMRERWNAEPQQRTRMLQHAERWQRMTPEQRKRAQTGQRRWEQMSPEQRKQARARFELGRDLPPQQRAALREQLKAMTPEQRREWIRTHRRKQGRTP